MPNLLSRLLNIALALFVVLGWLSPAAAAEGAGKPIGFALSVSTEGLLSIKVTKAEVVSVDAGSPAHSAGIASGDELIRVEGVAVPGGDGMKLRPLMQFKVGEPKRLAFRRKDGSEYEVTLTKSP